MKLLRIGLLAGAGALAYRAVRNRRHGSHVPRFQFLDPHSAGFVGLGGARFDAGEPLIARSSAHASAASAANDPVPRDDRDVLGSGIRTPGSELLEGDAP